MWRAISLRTCALLTGVLVLQGIPRAAGRSAQTAAVPPAPSREMLDKYCVSCHNDRAKTTGQAAGLSLAGIDPARIPDSAEIWEKVARKLRSGAMPPTGAPRPDQATADAFVTKLEASLDHAALVAPNPGRPAVHRLNRAEYANAIRDLLGMTIDARALLPPDDSAYGFDNIGDNLSVSPGLLDRYMAAARKIGRDAVGLESPDPEPPVTVYKVPKFYMQDDRVSEDLPFGSRGGLAAEHFFPLDGDYQIKIKMERNHSDVLRGLAEKNDIEIRVDRQLVKVFNVGGKAAVKYGQGNPCYATNTCKASDVEQIAEDANLDIRLPVKAGTHLVGVSFVDTKRAEPEGVQRPRVNAWQFDNADIGLSMIYTVTITGPYTGGMTGDTPSRRRIFVCRPASQSDEGACADRILSTLARRAYRRPVTKDEVKTLMAFYATGRSSGTFDTGIEFALRRMLVDPQFLFRVEQNPTNAVPESPYRISDLELASRLSFFLWSSLPDEELLDLAARGRLKNPDVLEQQVKRMLRDERSRALIDNFGGQWLFLRNVRLATPNPDIYPDWDENLREAYQTETELFFASMLREDHSVFDMLTADYTFLNEQLARQYHIPNVYGSHFRKVMLPADSPRRGLLGQGSILLVTSYADRTSPVKRGKWLLENLLGTPPPDPPPNVPPLADTVIRATSIRERMEAHRKNPVCAACHARMDPLGFALENFDGIGGWRDEDGGKKIDASGALPGGAIFDGPSGLRTMLLTHKYDFVTTVTDKLMTYALGRGTEYYDAPAVRQILHDAEANNYRWSSIILGIAKSTPFQMRRAAPPAKAQPLVASIH
jgi:hypothetical protein